MSLPESRAFWLKNYIISVAGVAASPSPPACTPMLLKVNRSSSVSDKIEAVSLFKAILLASSFLIAVFKGQQF